MDNQLMETARKIFNEIMPVSYPFKIVYVYNYMEIVPDANSRIFSEEELATLIDAFNVELKKETKGAHCVGGYKISNNSGRVKLQFVTVL